jgi:hypothetical protein
VTLWISYVVSSPRSEEEELIVGGDVAFEVHVSLHQRVVHVVREIG